MKTCFVCKKSMLPDQFGKNRRKKDGLDYCCKSCRKSIKTKAHKAFRPKSAIVNGRRYKVYCFRYRKTLFGPWIQVCHKCLQGKMLFAFNKHSNRKTGYLETCSKCRSNSRRNQYHSDEQHRISILEAQRERFKQPEVKEKHREWSRRYVRQNIEAHNARNRSWYTNNIDRARENSRKQTARYLATDNGKQKHLEWYASNPHHVRAHKERRRERSKNAEGHFTGKDILNLWHKQKGLCLNCRKQLGKTFQKAKFDVDHIYPISKGGSNWPSNLQLFCPTCNKRKHALLPTEFARRQGRLF